jgi:hypothetical protein
MGDETMPVKKAYKTCCYRELYDRFHGVWYCRKHWEQVEEAVEYQDSELQGLLEEWEVSWLREDERLDNPS